MVSYSQEYAAAVSAVTVTLTSLANGSGVDSSIIDNSVDLNIDADVEIKTNGQASGTGLLEVYLLSSIDNADFTDSANARLIGSVQMNSAVAVKKTLRLFDLPKYYKFRFVNQSGAALSATAGDHAVSFLGVKYKSV